MEKIIRLTILAACCPTLLLTSCVETSGLSSVPASGSASSSATSPAPAPAPAPAPEAMTKHDVALRFLTAFIRLDRNMAQLYATPEAVSKFDWNMSHRGNIPYYDDKMILYFNGGWARVYFQDVGGTFLISNFDVHRR